MTTQSSVNSSAVLIAMNAAASDSTSGDKVMAGIAYIIAKEYNHPMASKLLDGTLHVDAISPKKYKKLQGDEGASYQILTSENLQKANTLYLPTNIQLLSLVDKAMIIHELTHAEDDLNTKSQKQINELDFEYKAYKAEIMYFMNEYIKEQTTDIDELKIGGPTLDFFDKNKNPIRYWTLISLMKNDKNLRKEYLPYFKSESFYKYIKRDLKSSKSAYEYLKKALIREGYSSKNNIELIKEQGHFYHGKL